MNASGYEITRTRDAVNNVETFFQQRPELLKKATGVDQLVRLRTPIPRPTASSTAIRRTPSTRLTA
jgi:low-affinity inorganic phosphate transporter